MVMTRRSSAGWALLFVLLGGCTSPSPDLYSLDVQPGPVRAGRHQVVVIRGVSVPRYLEREQIVRAAGSTRVRVSENDWWGEPLRVMLRRVLAADLAQRLSGADVLGDDGSIAVHPDAEVTIDLQRFDGSFGGPVIFEGYAATTGPDRARTMDRLHVEVPVAADTTKAQIDAMSTALGQVANVIALHLRRRGFNAPRTGRPGARPAHAAVPPKGGG